MHRCAKAGTKEMAMAVKHALWATLLIISCQTTLAAADEEYGSFGAQVSDGSELKIGRAHV